MTTTARGVTLFDMQRFYFDNSSKSIGFFRASSKAVKDLNKYTDICEPVFLFYIKVIAPSGK